MPAPKNALPYDQRVVVLMTRQERAHLDEMAAQAGVTISQFIRRRIKGVDPDVATVVARLERLERHIGRGGA